MTHSFFTRFNERCSGSPSPDNSLAAIKTFYDVGETNYSISVQANNEDELLVIHSEKLEEETNASGFSHYLSVSDIDSVLYKNSQEKICTLKDVMDFFLSKNDDKKFNLCIEMRGNNTSRTLSNFLDGYAEHIGDERRINIIVSAENHLELTKLGERNPNVYLLAIIHGMPVSFEYIYYLQQAGIDGVKLMGGFLNHPLVNDIKARGMKVFVGEVNPATESLIGSKTDGIFLRQ